jgi:hypothetical protein
MVEVMSPSSHFARIECARHRSDLAARLLYSLVYMTSKSERRSGELRADAIVAERESRGREDSRVGDNEKTHTTSRGNGGPALTLPQNDEPSRA